MLKDARHFLGVRSVDCRGGREGGGGGGEGREGGSRGGGGSREGKSSRERGGREVSIISYSKLTIKYK